MVLAAPPASETPTLDRAFYSPSEVAKLASVSSATILNYIKAGRLAAIWLSARTVRIPRKAVVRFLEIEEPFPTIVDRPEVVVAP